MSDLLNPESANDDLTLGDVDKNLSTKGMSQQAKYILFGALAASALLIIIIVIIIISASSKNKNKNLQKIGEINCIYSIESTSQPTQLINKNYKESDISIIINGKEIKYSKQYKFDEIGSVNVQFVLYEAINMDNMFQDIEALTSVSLFSEKNAEITSMKGTFEGCTYLESFNISGFNTLKMKSISRLFYNCQSLEKINFGNINTENVEDMSYAFSNTLIDYFNFENIQINKLKNASHMFFESVNIQKIDIANLSSDSLEDISYMFSSCSSLEFIDINNLNTQNFKICLDYLLIAFF